MANLDLSHLSDKELSSLPDQDLAKIASSKKYKSEDDLLNDLSPDALNVIAGKKSPVSDIKNEIDDSNKMSRTDALMVSGAKGATLGLRPVIAGGGAGLGALIGELQRDVKGEGLSDKISRSFGAIKPAYSEGRESALAEQKKAETDRPGYALAGNIGGMALTLPFTAVRGIKGAMALGGAQGAAESISEGNSATKVLGDTLKGGAIGAASLGLAKGIEKAAPLVKAGLEKTGSFIGDKSKNILAKVGSALTGETEKNIKTYASKYTEIQKMMNASGGDISVAADNVRSQLSKQIQSFRQSQGAKIGEALDAVSPEKSINAKDVLGALDKVKQRINIKLNPEDASQIDDIIQKVSSLADDAGNVSLKEVHQIQDFLSDRAKGAYLKNGQIFVPGKTAQIAAKHGAREAKMILDKAVPELKEANSKLFQLHKIEENINKNLIAPGKSEAALLAAGGATTGRNRLYLDSLGKILGKDVTGEAEKLAAGAAFSSPTLLPKSAGGTTSTTRTLVAGALGTALSGPVGGAVTAAITSPMALKKAIQTGVISQKVFDATLGKVASFTGKSVDHAVKLLDTPEGISLFNRFLNSTEQSNPMMRRMEVLGNKNQNNN